MGRIQNTIAIPIYRVLLYPVIPCKHIIINCHIPSVEVEEVVESRGRMYRGEKREVNVLCIQFFHAYT